MLFPPPPLGNNNHSRPLATVAFGRPLSVNARQPAPILALLANQLGAQLALATFLATPINIALLDFCLPSAPPSNIQINLTKIRWRQQRKIQCLATHWATPVHILQVQSYSN